MLADIELAQAMQKEDTTKKKKVEVSTIQKTPCRKFSLAFITACEFIVFLVFFQSEEEIPHPLDVNYERLNCELELVDKKSKEFKVSRGKTILATAKIHSLIHLYLFYGLLLQNRRFVLDGAPPYHVPLNYIEL